MIDVYGLVVQIDVYGMITVMLPSSISVLFNLRLWFALTSLISTGLLEAESLSFQRCSVVEDLSTRLECKIRYIAVFCVLSLHSCHSQLANCHSPLDRF